MCATWALTQSECECDVMMIAMVNLNVGLGWPGLIPVPSPSQRWFTTGTEGLEKPLLMFYSIQTTLKWFSILIENCEGVERIIKLIRTVTHAVYQK